MPYSPVDELYTCSECMRMSIDPIDNPVHTINGWNVCRECVCCCTLCGEYMDDTLPTENGPAVRFREWENDGKLSRPTCARCAADWILGIFSDESGLFEAACQSRESIAIVVALAFAGKVAA